MSNASEPAVPGLTGSPRVLTNAMRFPSFDHVGDMSMPALIVSRVWPLPSAFIT
jgi:hypothetical protein